MGEEAELTLRCRNDLAWLYTNQGRYDEAEELYIGTLEIQRRLLGEEHPSTLGTLIGLGVLYQNQGRHDEAESFLAELLSIRRRVLPKEDRGTLSVLSLGSDGKKLHSARFNESVLATPAIANGRIFIRTAGTLYCFGMK